MHLTYRNKYSKIKESLYLKPTKKNKKFIKTPAMIRLLPQAGEVTLKRAIYLIDTAKAISSNSPGEAQSAWYRWNIEADVWKQSLKDENITQL